MTFLGWLSDPLKGLSDLQLGDEKVTLNHLVGIFLRGCQFYPVGSPPLPANVPGPLRPMLHPGDQENEGEPEAIHRQTVRRRDLVGLVISPSLKPMIHETDSMKNAQKSLDFYCRLSLLV